MVKKIFIAAALFLLLGGAAFAADYQFSVDENFSDVVIREDGGIDIKYRLTFSCAKNGKPIDIVDVGLPNSYFELDSVRAWINDVPVTGIKNSSVIPVGVEVPLSGHEINPGQTGTLTLTASNPHMVFPDSQDANFASVEFYPTYYGSEYTNGATRLRVAFHFPPGADRQKVKWHYSEFNKTEQDHEGRLVYIWELDKASPSQQYKFGVSFPNTLVQNIFEPVQDVYSTSPRISTRQKVLEDIASLLMFFGFFAIIVFVAYFANRRRKMKYFPPAAAVEGVEIKRGLMAPEAALLLEVPLNKVAAMIIFGLEKKGVIAIETTPKLNVKILNKNATDLNPYEKDFLLVHVDRSGAIPEKSLSIFFRQMIKDLSAKLEGFNMRKTRAHYRSIVDQAWQQVKSSGTDTEASQLLDENLSWLMIDKNMDGKLKDTLAERQVALPIWFFTGGYHGSAATTASAGSVSGVQFADQVVSRIEGVANSAVAKLEGFTGDITNITNPPPKSSGGGSGGGCACACAGCACACAGGGR